MCDIDPTLNPGQIGYTLLPNGKYYLEHLGTSEIIESKIQTGQGSYFIPYPLQLVNYLTFNYDETRSSRVTHPPWTQ